MTKLYPGITFLSPTELMVCRGCKHTAMRHIIESSFDYRKLTVGARRHGHPDTRSMAEIVYICPDCGATDPFTEVDYDE